MQILRVLLLAVSAVAFAGRLICNYQGNPVFWRIATTGLGTNRLSNRTGLEFHLPLVFKTQRRRVRGQDWSLNFAMA